METQNTMQGLMKTLEYYFVTKAPFQLPVGVKEFIVKYGPWLITLLVILAIPPILILLGLGVSTRLIFSDFSPMYYSHGWSLYSILSLASFVLMLIALPGLFKRKLSAWNLLFYSTAISFLSSIMYGYIFEALVSLLISLYILFQTKSYYN